MSARRSTRAGSKRTSTLPVSGLAWTAWTPRSLAMRSSRRYASPLRPRTAATRRRARPGTEVERATTGAPVTSGPPPTRRGPPGRNLARRGAGRRRALEAALLEVAIHLRVERATQGLGRPEHQIRDHTQQEFHE